MIRKIIFSSLIILIISANNIFGNVDNVLLQGKLINENDGSAIGAEVTFEDSEGDKIKVNADILTGAFEQLLKANHEYKITFQSPDIIRKVVDFKTKEATNYGEQKAEFSVIKLEANAKIMTLNLSDDGKNLSEIGKKSINELKILLRFNRSLYIDIVCVGTDLKNVLENVIKDKSWRIYKGKITIYEQSSYTKRKVELANDNDTVIIVNKVEDPFK